MLLTINLNTIYFDYYVGPYKVPFNITCGCQEIQLITQMFKLEAFKHFKDIPQENIQ